MVYDPRVESVFSKVFGRAPQTDQERSFLSSVASRKQGGALQGALEWQKQQGGAPGSLSPASNQPQTASQGSAQEDPVDNALEMAKQSVVKAGQRIQQANQRLFKRELRTELRGELMSNKGIKELLGQRGELSKGLAEVDLSVEGSETELPTTQGALKGKLLGSYLQNLSAVSGAYDARKGGINSIIENLRQGSQEELQGAQAEQQSAQGVLSSLISAEGEERNQQLFPGQLQQQQLGLQTEKLQQDQIRANIEKVRAELADGGDPEYTKSELLAYSEALNVPPDEKAITAAIAAGKVPVGATDKPTVDEGKASDFYGRSLNANQILQTNEAGITKMGTIGYAAARNIPNFAKSPLIQSQLQAEREFVNAILRRDTGATITPDEYKNYSQQYFPQPGDNQSTILQKSRSRQVAISGLKRASGKSAAGVEGEAANAPANDPLGLFK